ncbi:hypothetical protein [Mycolicibacterium houstonense]|uniref:hypothetical protein n=1 Tax=Mycolicibacterium houstonense TaxID=146021 RepID=UPI001359D343|nr:hypothetical protein [Mycolicibacterium houstonense]
MNLCPVIRTSGTPPVTVSAAATGRNVSSSAGCDPISCSSAGAGERRRCWVMATVGALPVMIRLALAGCRMLLV